MTNLWENLSITLITLAGEGYAGKKSYGFSCFPSTALARLGFARWQLNSFKEYSFAKPEPWPCAGVYYLKPNDDLAEINVASPIALKAQHSLV